MKETSPEFDHFNFEPILTWAEANVEFYDDFIGIDGEDKNEDDFIPDLTCWVLSWKNGVISFTHIRTKEDEHQARMNAALFIYLWTRGVSADIADQCSSTYVLNVIKERIKS